MTTKKNSAQEEETAEAKPAKKAGGAAAAAGKILSDESPQSKIAEHGETMMEGPRTAATQSARVLSEVIAEKPELVVPLVAKFAKGISSSNKRVVQTAAEALPAIVHQVVCQLLREKRPIENALGSQAVEKAHPSMERGIGMAADQGVSSQRPGR